MGIFHGYGRCAAAAFLLCGLFGSVSVAETFVAPSSGTLYVKCVGGSAGAVSQFGTGTSQSNFVPYLNSLPASCPTSEVSIGTVTAGQVVPFGIYTLWQGQSYWAFSTGTDEASMVSFNDLNNSLGMNGNIIQQTGTNLWVMHLNDAAHYTISSDEANNILIQLRLSTGNAPQIGGGNCSTSMLNGTYFYVLAGTIASGGQAGPYAELGELEADGSGNVSGKSFASVNGQPGTYSLAGTYSVQGSCTGTISLTVNSTASASLTFQLIGNGQGMIVAISNSAEVVTGRAFRQTAQTGSIQCNNGSLSGNFGYLLTGVAASSLYSDSGQLTSDGNGNLTTNSIANVGGTISNITGTGTYSVTSQCYGTASVTTQAGTSNYVFAIAQDGQDVLFLETDTGTTVGGSAQPQFTAPQQAVVNGASFRPGMVAPGSLFSIFGTGLSSQTASAQTLPLPTTLGQTQVLVNGTPAPLVYVSGGQINAQMPVGVPTGQPITLAVTSAGLTSNTVAMDIPAGAPGIFTTNGTQAILQNPNGSINSSTSPAHVGDVLVAYLTGGGAVNNGSWTSGTASPASAASVTAPYTLTVGNQPAQVEYLGLTPGFVGLYQANFTVPSLAAGTYPIVVTVAGNASNAATVVVGG